MTDNLPEVTQPGPATMFALIERMAANPAVDIGKLQALLDMQERLMARDAESEFNQAYGRLQMALPRITKKGEVQYPVNKNNPDGPMRHAFDYARYEDIDALLRPLLNGEGFSLTYNTEPQANGTVLVKGALLHVGGHQRHSQIGPLPLDTSGGKNNLQAAASTFSYGKRYCATMLLNLVFEGEDDDGVRGGIVYITDAEVSEIEAEIKARAIDRLRFLEFLGVSEIANIQAKDKAAAMNAIAMKRKRASADTPPSGAGAEAAAATVPASSISAPVRDAPEAGREGPILAGRTPPPVDNDPPPAGGKAAGARGGRREPVADAAENRDEVALATNSAGGGRHPTAAYQLPDDAPRYIGEPEHEAAQIEHTESRPIGEVGTQRSAKPPGAGSTPASASTDDLSQRLTEAASKGVKHFDRFWVHVLTPEERALAAPMCGQYREIAQKAGG